jgi:hypothetical protein
MLGIAVCPCHSGNPDKPPWPAGSSWGAAIDRLAHRATILVFEGESVRTKEAKSRQTA